VEPAGPRGSQCDEHQCI